MEIVEITLVLLLITAAESNVVDDAVPRERKRSMPAPGSPSDRPKPLVLFSSSTRMRWLASVLAVVRIHAVTVKLPDVPRLPTPAGSAT